MQQRRLFEIDFDAKHALAFRVAGDRRQAVVIPMTAPHSKGAKRSVGETKANRQARPATEKS